MRTSYQAKDICSIIVTYQIQPKKFKNCLKLHQENFTQIIVVNNSPEIDLSSLQTNQIILINNPNNIGLAAALNVGIKEAKKKCFQMVALFDQDTILQENFIQQMLKYINNFQAKKKLVAVYSPVYYNQVTKETSRHISFKPFRLVRSLVDNDNYASPYYVITSGSFIPIDVLDEVGPMREELFIDFVDIEWCLRARKKNYHIVAINKVVINHHLGDYAISFMRHRYPIHSPLRMYYYFRNATYLYHLEGIDWNWRFVDFSRNLFRLLFYLVLVKDRLTYFRYIMKGKYHGIIKKMGKLEE